ncbi:MAG: hypothetical protein AAF961_19220, partial [Planctomycetota bacterium]
GVDEFDGEGVTPIQPGTPTAGVNATILAAARSGQSTRINAPPWSNNSTRQGMSRSVDASDAALLIAGVDAGRIAAHYDRNTFFNQNGAGTDILRNDNRIYALNLFEWLVGRLDTADFDSNDAVDGADFLAWQRHIGIAGDAAPADGDADHDLDVDAYDLTVWEAEFGQTAAAPSAIAYARADPSPLLGDERSSRVVIDDAIIAAASSRSVGTKWETFVDEQAELPPEDEAPPQPSSAAPPSLPLALNATAPNQQADADRPATDAELQDAILADWFDSLN